MKMPWGMIVLRVAAMLGLFLAPSVRAASLDSIAKAEELYKRTEFEASLALLSGENENHAAEFLIGRDYFMLGDFRKANEYFLKASQGEPNNSEYMDWLGRVYGRRAETANLFAAPGYASKARQAFEQSVRLDPRNKEALSDLFDYYLEAPGFMGGGYDKAEAVAGKMAVVDPPEAYFSRAKLEQKRKEFGTAEQHLRQAIAIAPHEVGHVITLAKFLANQGRNRESDAVLLAAQRDHPNVPQIWFARADILVQQKRDLDEAKRLLEKYMQASLTVDDPPKEKAARLLKQAGGA